jgi:hypothetical protein
VPEYVESTTVVQDPLPPLEFPEFLLFDFLARGLAEFEDEVVEAFFSRMRLLIEVVRNDPRH